MSNPPVQYKVFVRVPFARGQFVDPPDPRWNAQKDKELWRVLSSTNKRVDTDWNGLADRFEVTLPFLLQQAAYLYDRQLSQVREQLRRVKPSIPSVAPSPTPPLDSASASAVGGQPMRRLGSAASGAARVSSNLSTRPRTSFDGPPRTSLDGPREGSAVASPVQERATRVPYSRQTSANTITQAQKPAPVSEAAQSPGTAPSAHATGATNASVIRRAKLPAPEDSSPKASPSASASSSSDEEDRGKGMGQSRAFARRPQFSRIINKGKAKAGRLSSVASADGSDASSGSDSEFLPFASALPSKPSSGGGDGRSGVPSGATAHHRRTEQRAAAHNLHIRPSTATQTPRLDAAEPKTPRAEFKPRREVTASGLSSSPSQSESAAESTSMSQRSMSNPLVDGLHKSPLNALSPKQRRSVVAREGSDTGSPSMGSSFSDLDDASVNTSAMEEALAHQMRVGGLGATSALRSSLAMGGRLGGLWRGTQGGQGS